MLGVTDICFDVGYNSLGTFTTRFTQLVGLSPARLRRLGSGFRLESPGAGAAVFRTGEGGLGSRSPVRWRPTSPRPGRSSWACSATRSTARGPSPARCAPP